MIENVYQYRENLKKQGVYLSVTGPFSHIIMEEIAEMLKKKMEMENVKTSTMMNVFTVVVELVQNIIHYSAETIPGDMVGEQRTKIRLGTLVMGYENDHYFVLSGNMIENVKVEPLRDRLNKIRSMTKDELKQLYKEKLRQPKDSASKGAGIGFIEMARKVSQPFDFDFQPIDGEFSFFSVKMII